MLENTELFVLPAAFCEVFTTTAPRTWNSRATRGQFLVARGARQGCPASGFLFAMAFDPIFRWLQESIIPRILDNWKFLQPAQCTYADDLAVASFSFRGIMTALAPASHSVEVDVCGFHFGFQGFWKVSKHGAFSIPRQALALCSIDQKLPS